MTKKKIYRQFLYLGSIVPLARQFIFAVKLLIKLKFYALIILRNTHVVQHPYQYNRSLWIELIAILHLLVLNGWQIKSAILAGKNGLF